MAKDTAGPRSAFAVKSEPVTPTTTTQKVERDAAQQQLSVWVPKDLVKRLKVRGAETDQSLKEMVIEALERFL